MNTMYDDMLHVHNLSISYEQNRSLTNVIDAVSFSIKKNEILSILGESGCGKSTLAKSLCGLLPASARITNGTLCFNGIFKADMTSNKTAWNQVRGKEIGMIFQDSELSLNPVMKILDHFQETLVYHQIAAKEEAAAITASLLKTLNFNDTDRVIHAYPFQLSGGMCQRICIALALCLKPKLLIADEPTSALDVVSQKEALELLNRVKNDFGISVLLITHDIAIADKTGDRVIILDRGKIVEEGAAFSVFTNPKHSYTQHLLSSRTLNLTKKAPIEERKDTETLKITNLVKKYEHKSILNNINFSLYKNEIFGILGESGCGKSTLAKCLTGIEPYQAGSITGLTDQRKRDKCRHIQMIFQDARASLNPGRSALEIVIEPLAYLDIAPKNERITAGRRALDEVGITGDMQGRRPPQLSTGQCQRIALARAIIIKPDVLICDEAVSALDMSIQAQILELLEKLYAQYNLSIVMISHDLRILRYFCHRIAVMKNGAFLEIRAAGDAFNASKETYTQQLLTCEREMELKTICT